MLDHISITVADIGRSAIFWDAVMTALGVPCVTRNEHQLGYGTRNRPEDDGHSYISIFQSRGPELVPDNRHWCFRAPNREAVAAFHAAGRAAGGRCDGPPGLRADYHPGYYAAFLLDPDGNRIEAVHHRLPEDG
jgi:catechol 2,3-dioxygenase-like lactoylglutathione lyase family enzyme